MSAVYQYVVSLLAPSNVLGFMYVLPDNNIAMLIFFWLAFALNIFFQSPYFQPFQVLIF